MLIDGLEGHEGSVLYPPVARCARCARTAAVAVGRFMRWSQRMVERCAPEACDHPERRTLHSVSVLRCTTPRFGPGRAVLNSGR